MARALNKDVKYRISNNLKQGAADTRFSGKIFTRLGRVMVIANELRALQGGATAETLGYDDVNPKSFVRTIEAARSVFLLMRDKIDALVKQTKLCIQVKIWINNN